MEHTLVYLSDRQLELGEILKNIQKFMTFDLDRYDKKIINYIREKVRDKNLRVMFYKGPQSRYTVMIH